MPSENVVERKIQEGYKRQKDVEEEDVSTTG